MVKATLKQLWKKPPTQSFLGESRGEEGNTTPLKTTAWEATVKAIQHVLNGIRFVSEHLELLEHRQSYNEYR